MLQVRNFGSVQSALVNSIQPRRTGRAAIFFKKRRQNEEWRERANLAGSAMIRKKPLAQAAVKKLGLRVDEQLKQSFLGNGTIPYEYYQMFWFASLLLS